MIQKQTTSTAPSSSENGSSLERARIVLVANAATLQYYEPVLHRMMLGLLDEVEDLTLLCLGRCVLADFVPCPPVRIITETRREPTYERFDVNSRKVTIRTPRSRLGNMLLPHRRVQRLANALTPYKPTIVHALGETHGHLVRQLSKQLRVPYVVSYLGLEGEPSHVNSQRCAAVVCCNSQAARHTRKSRKITAAKVHLVPIGTHVSKDSCCFKHEETVTNLLYVGPLDDGLGLAELINALRRLTNKGQLCHLTLCGQGHGERHLRQQADRLGLTEQVHFMPPLNDFLHHSHAGKVVMKASDIFVQPWPSKTLRPELLDAMSMGTVVVAAKGQQCDLLIDKQTAAMVPFKDEDKLLEALETLLKDKQYAMKLTHQAQDYLRKHFQTSYMVERLGRVYRQASSLYASLKKASAETKKTKQPTDKSKNQTAEGDS